MTAAKNIPLKPRAASEIRPLSVREQVATLALAGVLASPRRSDAATLAKQSIVCADCLLGELGHTDERAVHQIRPLSVREQIAAQCLSGMLASERKEMPSVFAKHAVEYAETLLAQLEAGHGA